MTEGTPAAVAPAEGKTTIDDKMRFGPLRLSYQSTSDISHAITCAVAERIKGRVVVIAGTGVLADFANLQAALLTLERLQRDYESIAKYASSMSLRRSRGADRELLGDVAGIKIAGAAAAATGAAVAVAPISSLLTAALGVVSLFREDVEYGGVDAPIDRLAFDLAVAASAKSSGAAEVYVPDLMIIPLAAASSNSLRGRLAAIEEAKTNAWMAAAPLVAQLADVEAQLDRATRDKDKAGIDRLHIEAANLRRDMEPLVGPLTRADQLCADLQTQWSRIEQNSELSVLARMLRAEAIHELQPNYLHCAVVASGGHHRVSRSLLRFIFTGDGLSFTGGAIARWALLAPNGAVESGGIIPSQQTTERSWFA